MKGGGDEPALLSAQGQLLIALVEHCSLNPLAVYITKINIY